MSLVIMDSGGSGQLGTINLGTLNPGETYSVKNGAPFIAVLSNTGPGDYESVTISLGAVAQYPSINYLRFAVTSDPGTPPDPSDWNAAIDGPFDAGPLAEEGALAIWIDAIVPISADAGRAQLARLVASGILGE